VTEIFWGVSGQAYYLLLQSTLNYSNWVVMTIILVSYLVVYLLKTVNYSHHAHYLYVACACSYNKT